MKNLKMYEANDKMITLIKDNYNLLQTLGSFGIKLGFGDKTVRETCELNHVDTYTFLAVVNYTMNGYTDYDEDKQIDIRTLLRYLEASHTYFLDHQLPSIRRQLAESFDEQDSLGHLIMKFYDGYAREIQRHMKYEEKTLFPYVTALLDGRPMSNYNVETFSKHHEATDKEWLTQHAEVEDHIFVPAIRRLEQETKQNDVTKNISTMVFKNGQDANETLSDRERDVIIALVQGMSNKEIADHLCISVNTVITHRRNIARKLQIHSPAGLTIYAIVNGLVDISAVKL